MKTVRDDYCKERVWPPGSFSGHQCSRKAKTDGYCTQHHPDNVDARRKAREEKWRRMWKAQSLADAKTAARRDAEKRMAELTSEAIVVLRTSDDPVVLDLRAEMIDAYQLWRDNQ